MAKSRREQERRDEVVSAKRWTESQQGGFNRTALNVPSGVTMFKPEGDKVYKLDFIPYRVGKGNPMADEGMLHFERTYFMHPNVGVDKKPYCCLRQFNKTCPVCSEWEQKKASVKTQDDGKKLYSFYAPKKRQLWNVIDTENRDKGVQLWDVSYHLFGKALVEKIKKADDDEKEAYEAFSDPKQGMTLRIATTKETMGSNTYADCSDIEFKKRKEQYESSIMDDALCLDDIVREVSFDELEATLVGESTHDEDDPKPKGKKPVAKDDEDDDEDDEEDDEPKAKGKKPVAKDDDDDDDDDEDDEPKAKGKKPVAKKKGESAATAESLGLKLGTKVKYDGNTCEIVKITGEGSTLTLEDEDEEIHHKVKVTDVAVIKKGKK